MAIGSLEWTRRTGGELTAAESRLILRQTLALQCKLIPEEVFTKLGLRSVKPIDNFEELAAPPDSEFCNKADQVCRDASPGYLYNHSARAYIWGRIFATLEGQTVDPEILYISAMFHDIGLTKAYLEKEDRRPCFTLASEAAAQQVLTGVGYDQRRADAVSEAITLHLNARIDPSYGPEARYLNMATAMDVATLRLYRMPKEAVRAGLEKFPRLDQNETLSCCWAEEAKRFPKTRAGWLEKYLQFSKRVRKAKF